MKRLFYYPLRTLLRFIRDLDGIFTTATQLIIKPKFKRQGACKKRGICCQNIAICLSPTFWKYPSLTKLMVRYYCFVYNFEYVHQLPEQKVLLFRCNYLKGTQCQIHWKRPFICRNYPKPRYFDTPELLPGCGYSFIGKQKKKKELLHDSI